MSKDEIDIMWQKAIKESIKDGEMFTRYHFAKLVAAKEREACAKVVDHILKEGGGTWGDAIRARREQA
jgi:hypothetical protein